jgi:hypothetical protein
MHIGNDVAYVETKEQLSIYRSVREAIWSRIKVNSRLMPYTRLLIEPLFAYNHFEDEDGLEFEEVEESDGSAGSSQKSDSDEEVEIDDTGVKVKI